MPEVIIEQQQHQQHMLYDASNCQQTQILSTVASSYQQPVTSIYSQHNFGSVAQQPPLNSGNVFMTADVISLALKSTNECMNARMHE
mgnify:CR=1 FL=1